MTLTEKNNSLTFLYAASFIALLASLYPWLSTFLSHAINTDIAFLTLSAGRMLNGQTMSEGYYDTNLPLSIIIQLPPALLARVTTVPVYYATSIYSLTLFALSTLATHQLLKYFKDIKIEHHYAILVAYILSNTIIPGYDFGQKDHLLSMALFPLVLAQVLITQGIALPKGLKHIVLAAGSLFILLKPHYGIIPAVIFIHRAITQKRINVIFDADFIWLAVMATGYAGAVFLLMPDFMSIILPDIIEYYASDISDKVVATGIILMLQAITPFFIAQLFLKDAPKLLSTFSIIATLCLIPFIMQGKGWMYHAIPAQTFFYCAASLLITSIIPYLFNMIFGNKRQYIGRLLSMLVIMAISGWTITKYYEKQSSEHIITHEQYKNTDFAKMISDCKTKEAASHKCSFLMLDPIINISKELSVYTGAPHATRFSHLWFLPFLLTAQDRLDEDLPPLMSKDELNKAVGKYTNLMADDFDKYKPDLLFIPHIIDPRTNKPFNVLDYLMKNNPWRFNLIMKNYKIDKSVIVNRLDYMVAKLPNEDVILYDIYKRVSN